MFSDLMDRIKEDISKASFLYSTRGSRWPYARSPTPWRSASMLRRYSCQWLSIRSRMMARSKNTRRSGCSIDIFSS